MRHNAPSISFDPLPECPECGAMLTYTRYVDVARDGRAHFVFQCGSCGRETKIWRSEWQALTDEFLTIDL